ncbi:MAG: hypothetical protein P4L53_26485 [Candidatus Obscuribacterales bacterium]|nr:hypothetical protein [Candidatus Obscuribacterales bacterium]
MKRSMFIVCLLCLLLFQGLFEPLGVGATALKRKHSTTVRKAAKPSTHNLSDRISSSSKVTYFALLKRVFPDITMDGAATKSLPIEQLMDNYEKQPLEGDLEISCDNSIPFQSGKTKLLFLTISVRNSNEAIWGENFLLAAYDVTQRVKLLDVVDVQCDRFCSLVKPQPALSNNSSMPIVLITNTHFNCQENFEIYTLLGLAHNKIVAVCDKLPFAYCCRMEEKALTQAPYIIPMPTKAHTPSKFAYRIELTETFFDSDCQTVKRTKSKSYGQLFVWRSGEYVPLSDKWMKPLRAEEHRLGFENNQ